MKWQVELIRIQRGQALSPKSGQSGAGMEEGQAPEKAAVVPEPICVPAPEPSYCLQAREGRNTFR